MHPGLPCLLLLSFNFGFGWHSTQMEKIFDARQKQGNGKAKAKEGKEMEGKAWNPE
jgi:hypothetical protein